jgi:hypothetical protein
LLKRLIFDTNKISCKDSKGTRFNTVAAPATVCKDGYFSKPLGQTLGLGREKQPLDLQARKPAILLRHFYRSGGLMESMSPHIP